MSKTTNTTPSYPSFSDGAVQVNGRTVATSHKDGNTISTNYNMSDTEKKYVDKIQSGLTSSLDNLFNITDQQRKEWGNQLDALKTRGIENIESIYAPMETNLRNSVASRFGNLDNSVFMDNLNKITDKRARAVADLSNTITSAQDSLYANEIANRANIISLLDSLNTSFNNNMLNYINSAVTNSTSGNTHNNNSYQSTNSSNGNYLNNYLAYASTALSFLR